MLLPYWVLDPPPREIFPDDKTVENQGYFVVASVSFLCSRGIAEFPPGEISFEDLLDVCFSPKNPLWKKKFIESFKIHRFWEMIFFLRKAAKVGGKCLALNFKT